MMIYPPTADRLFTGFSVELRMTGWSVLYPSLVDGFMTGFSIESRMTPQYFGGRSWNEFRMTRE